MKILVAGGLRDDYTSGNAEEVCARALGRAIVSKSHVLINGCYNPFDKFVAEGAEEAAKKQGVSGKNFIFSYVYPDGTPIHDLGQLRENNVRIWDPGQPDWGIPEPLVECEAVVVMGGGASTRRVVNISRFAGKPILPITAFGGAGREAFRAEWARFEALYGGRVDMEEFANLNTPLKGLDKPHAFDDLAAAVVTLTSKIVLGNKIFVVMSFRKESDDTYGTIKRACEAYGFAPDRTDKNEATTDRIYSRIVRGIQQAAFLVADVTFDSVNVYYELGFAEALGKEVIVVAKEGTKLPFDTNDIPTVFFPDQTRLEEALCSRIERLSGRLLSGRVPV
jgi:nucleoside 2-deoxyribosyltransferase